jgi:hypothetical protein
MALWIAVTHCLADCERHRDCNWFPGVALAEPEASLRSFPIDKQTVGWLTGQTAKYSGVLIWAIPTVDWLSAGRAGELLFVPGGARPALGGAFG